MPVEITQPSDQRPTVVGNQVASKAGIDAKIAFLRTQIDRRISGFESRRQQNRRNALWIKILASTLGIMVTILLGLQLTHGKELLSNIALVLSGLITLLSVLEGFFDHRVLWIRYTVTTNQLRALKSDLEYSLAGGPESIPEEELDQLYRRYSEILEEANRAWTEIRKQDSSKSDV